MKIGTYLALALSLALSSFAEEKAAAKPIELEAIQSLAGIWDAEIEVWPSGPDSPSIKFKGIEKNRPYGEHWVASDFDSEFMGQSMKIHSIVGYDLDQKQLVGTVIDHGPYSASMQGTYEKESKTVHWTTKAKDLNGKIMLQKTFMTQKNANERVLVLMTHGADKSDFNKFMQIKYIKRP